MEWFGSILARVHLVSTLKTSYLPFFLRQPDDREGPEMHRPRRRSVRAGPEGNELHAILCLSLSNYIFAQATVESPSGVHYQVHITLPNHYACDCEFGAEFQRPCAHVVAAILSCRHLNAWDKQWFGPVWQSSQWLLQWKQPVKRLAVLAPSHREADLVPAALTAKPGRKRQRPYVPHPTKPRQCFACGGKGHYATSCPNPNMARIVKKKSKETSKAIKAIIDLTNDD